LQSVVVLLLAPGAARNAVQFGIHHGHNFVEGLRIAISPSVKQDSHFTLWGFIHPL